METSFTELWWSLRTVEELVVQAVRSKGLETTHTLWQWSSSKCHPGGTTSLIKCWAYLFLHPWTCRLQKEPLCQKEVLFHVIPSHQGPPIFMVPGFFGWALNCQPTALCLCQDTRLYPEAVSLARTSRTLALGGVVGEVTIFAPQLMKLYLCYSVAAAFLCKVYLDIFTACLMVTMANLGVLQYMMRSCSTTLWHATHSTTYFNHHIHTIRHEHSASHSIPLS